MSRMMKEEEDDVLRLVGGVRCLTCLAQGPGLTACPCTRLGWADAAPRHWLLGMTLSEKLTVRSKFTS